jgi:hypothetical protein
VGAPALVAYWVVVAASTGVVGLKVVRDALHMRIEVLATQASIRVAREARSY